MSKQASSGAYSTTSSFRRRLRACRNTSIKDEFTWFVHLLSRNQCRVVTPPLDRNAGHGAPLRVIRITWSAKGANCRDKARRTGGHPGLAGVANGADGSWATRRAGHSTNLAGPTYPVLRPSRSARSRPSGLHGVVPTPTSVRFHLPKPGWFVLPRMRCNGHRTV